MKSSKKRHILPQDLPLYPFRKKGTYLQTIEFRKAPSRGRRQGVEEEEVLLLRRFAEIK
jgi:hypothetical protein